MYNNKVYNICIMKKTFFILTAMVALAFTSCNSSEAPTVEETIVDSVTIEVSDSVTTDSTTSDSVK